jgi:hypothetical protein
MIKAVNDFFLKQVWSAKEFMMLAFVIVMNPALMLAIDLVFGAAFVLGILTGWLVLLVLKTKWGQS